MRLTDKVAIVIGADSGIRRAIADCFAGEGAIVAVAARNQARIDQTVEEIKSADGNAFGRQADISERLNVAERAFLRFESGCPLGVRPRSPAQCAD